MKYECSYSESPFDIKSLSKLVSNKVATLNESIDRNEMTHLENNLKSLT